MNLTKDPIPILIKQIAFPASIGMLFSTFYNVVGTFFAGLISTEAVAGISICFFLYFMIIGIGFGFGAALTAIIGNYLGRARIKAARIYAHKGFFFMIGFGVFMGFVGYFGAPFVLEILGAKEGGFMKPALDYIRVILISSPFFLGTNALNGILVSLGDTKTYRNWLIIGLFVNVALTPLLMYGFGFIPPLEISGIALSTATTQLIGMIYLFRKVYKKRIITFDKFEYFYPDLRAYKTIIKQGIPSCLNYLSIALGSLVIMYFVSQYGTNAVAGVGIALRIEQMALLPTIGMSSAVLALISRNYGAKEYERVKNTFFYAIKIATISCIIMACLCIILGPRLIWFFDKNSEVIAIGTTYLYFDSFSFIGYTFIFICASALQGIKRPNAIFTLNFIRQVPFQFIVQHTLVVAFALPITYMWMGLLGITYTICGIFMWWTIRLLKRINYTK